VIAPLMSPLLLLCIGEWLVCSDCWKI